MPWWGWLVVGIGLLGVEMFVIDAQFYLVFLGVAATIVGLLGLAGVAMPEWAAVAALCGACRRRDARPSGAASMQLVRGRTGHVQERVTLGDRVVVPARLEPGQTCRVDYRGSSWTARNVDSVAIEAGSEAADRARRRLDPASQIRRARGLTTGMKHHGNALRRCWSSRFW